MPLSVREDAQAATRKRRPPKTTLGSNDRYLVAGEPLDLEPRYCRCSRPAPVAEVDRVSTTITVSCITCGRERAVLNRLDLAALAVARRAQL